MNVPDAKEVSEAKHDFQAGLKFKDSGNLDVALEKFEHAARLNPRNADYVAAREFTRQELVMASIKQGTQALDDNNDILAMASFRRALEYDPSNEFAQERLREVLLENQPAEDSNVRVVQRSLEVHLNPEKARHDFHLRGDARGVLTQVAQAYGITPVFDDSVQQRRLHFDVENVGFFTAMELATRATKTFWVPLQSREMLIAADTAENRRNLERMSLRTFYLSNVSKPQDLVEMVNALRILLEIRYISQDPAASSITIRASQPVLDTATQLIEALSAGRPEVMLDVQVFEISENLMRQLGGSPPTQFTAFNLSPALLASVGGTSTQTLINQIIASGGINQANASSIQALLGQLQNSAVNSLLQNPFATFGGGLTLFALTGGTGATWNFSLNKSDVQQLDHLTLRASQNQDATFKIGERYPIVNATFAPIYNTSAISKVLGNQSYVAPFPSIQYEDIGLAVKATPIIHEDRDVTLKFELQVRTLGGQSVNGVPIILNREYTGSITMKNGETGVVAGLISDTDARTLSGYPFLARVPGLNYVFAQHDVNVDNDDLLVLITPHVVRTAEDNLVLVQIPTGH